MTTRAPIAKAKSAHYVLPDGNVQIAFSGGRTSAYMLHQILEANGALPDRCIVTFQNTGRERPETLDFVQGCANRWGVDIVWLEYRQEKPLYEVVSHNSASRNGEPFEFLIKKKQGLPNQFQKWCSAELKTLTAKRYLFRERKWKAWTTAIGFRSDEMERKPFKDNRSTHWLPLRDAGVSRHDVHSFWQSMPFDLRLPTFRGKTVGGNCDGCFLKSERYLAGFLRDEPERASWWKDQEERTGRSFSKRFTLAALSNFVEMQGDWILSDAAGLCQREDGECF